MQSNDVTKQVYLGVQGENNKTTKINQKYNTIRTCTGKLVRYVLQLLVEEYGTETNSF